MKTYKSCGVDVNKANSLVSDYNSIAKNTNQTYVLDDLGGFGGTCRIPSRYYDPVLVGTADGVGTKVKLATRYNKFDTIGIDLVAMCVNDLLACGAIPLFFMDYLSVGKLNKTHANQIVKGIGEGCNVANCALLGGETAEMPNLYFYNDSFDLAGFAIGVKERGFKLDGSRVKEGNKIIGFPSNGIHSNGYSLVRSLFYNEIGNKEYANTLLKPTKIYYDIIKDLLNLKVEIRGMAHITGGGLIDNPARMLPKNSNLSCGLYMNWDVPNIFEEIQTRGNIGEIEMCKVFNMGIGFMIIVSDEVTQYILDSFKSCGASLIGEVLIGPEPVMLLGSSWI